MNTFLVNLSKRMERVSAKQRLVFGILVMIVGPLTSGHLVGAEKLKELTDGIGMLDMEFWYSPAKALATIDALGSEGREFYGWLLVLDFAVIIAFGLMQSAFTTYLLQKLSVPERWLRLNLLPFIRGGFDVVENCCLLLLVLRFPAPLTGVARIAVIATSLKWTFMTTSMGVILLAIVGVGWKARIQRIEVAKTFEIKSTV